MNMQEAKTRARALVERMTVEERISQLRYDSPAIDRLGIHEYNWWNEASHGVARSGMATVFPHAIALASSFHHLHRFQFLWSCIQFVRVRLYRFRKE